VGKDRPQKNAAEAATFLTLMRDHVFVSDALASDHGRRLSGGL
jgi:hypothetical protein